MKTQTIQTTKKDEALRCGCETKPDVSKQTTTMKAAVIHGFGDFDVL